jgi:hypothetical protein
LFSESALLKKAQKERGIWFLMQGGERTGQPEQDRHGHLRQFQLQVQVSEFETTSQCGFID